MDVKDNMMEAIGNTPMIHLGRIEKKYNLSSSLYAKLERCNPTGSIKDRIAREMIEGALKRGEITKDTVILEPTSGNTGIGLAAICASLGLELHIFMPSNCSEERVLMMKAFGAKVFLVQEGGMSGCIEKANEDSKKYASFYIPSQFSNRDNPLAHYKTTGPEIYTQMDGKVDIFLSAFGTGGTLTGVSKYLKEKNPNIISIGIEPASSPFITEGKKGPHKIQGIGAGFKPDVLNLKEVDKILTVSDEDAYKMTRELARCEGLFCGISSGACLEGAIEVAKGVKGKNIVLILPDDGERYLSVENLYE